MQLRRYSSFLHLSLVVSACGTAPTPFGEQAATATVPRGDRNLIVRAELAELPGQTLVEAVERLRRNWMRPGLPWVMVDGLSRGPFQELYSILTNDVETLRYLSWTDATTRYGTGFRAGVIEVTSRDR